VPAHYDEHQQKYVLDYPFPCEYDAAAKHWDFAGGEISWDQVFARWKQRGPMNERYVESVRRSHGPLGRLLDGPRSGRHHGPAGATAPRTSSADTRSAQKWHSAVLEAATRTLHELTTPDSPRDDRYRSRPRRRCAVAGVA
jgi:hypothetical protein